MQEVLLHFIEFLRWLQADSLGQLPGAEDMQEWLLLQESDLSTGLREKDLE